MKRLLVSLAVTAVLQGGLLSAQDSNKTYELKLKCPPVVGHKTDMTHTESQKMSMVIKAGDQVVQAVNQAEDRSFAALEEILKVEGDKPTLLRWKFSKAVKMAEGKETVFGFQGKTVLVKKSEGQDTEYSYEGGARLEGEDLDAVRKAFMGNEEKKGSSAEEMFAPKKPVKVGESWNPPLEAITKGMFDGDMAQAVDLKSSKTMFTLKSVSDRSGVLFGKIEALMDLALTQMGPLKLDTPIKMKMTGDFDVCIDGKIPDGELKLVMVMKGSTTSEGPNGVMFSIDTDMNVKTVGQKRTAK
jgi:hypothetical protein